MQNYIHNIIILFFFTISIISCDFMKKEHTAINKEEAYLGWWIYGEGQHLFKDELTLQEWELKFPNENMDNLVELYLSITDMEYFPMECKMIGKHKIDSVGNIELVIFDFEVLYVEGCGE